MYAPPSIDPSGLADVEVREDEGQFNKRIPDAKPAFSKQKILKDGSMDIKTKDIHAAKNRMDTLVKRFNAYYETEDLANNSSTITYRIKIRVPAMNFEPLLQAMEQGDDEIISKSIRTRDITEEYIDITSRLQNKKDYLKRYREILSKAATVKDILAIEEKIRPLQEEIESSEGRIRYLDDQLAFSNLDLRLFREKEYVFTPEQQDKFSERVKRALNGGWTSVVSFVLVTIRIWPLLILLALVILLIRRMAKARRVQHKTSSNE